MTVPSLKRGQRYVWLTYCFLCILIVSGLFFSSCNAPSLNNQSAATSSGTGVELNTLISPLVLTVGSDASYLPQEYVDPTTRRITGFDIDLIDALAQRAHLQVRVVQDNFPQLISDLLAKRFDVVISAIGITPELTKEVNFIPYFVGGESLMVRKGNPDHISTLSDLCGLAVAVKSSAVEKQELLSMNDMCRKKGKKAITIRSMKDVSSTIQLLQKQQVVAVYQDASITDYYIKQQPAIFERGGSIINPTLEGIAIRKNDTKTLQALQTLFKQLQVDGTYHALITKWGLFSGDITTSSL
jgi:polar amino acid transport system substrate-binding protein